MLQNGVHAESSTVDEYGLGIINAGSPQLSIFCEIDSADTSTTVDDHLIILLQDTFIPLPEEVAILQAEHDTQPAGGGGESGIGIIIALRGYEIIQKAPVASGQQIISTEGNARCIRKIELAVVADVASRADSTAQREQGG